MKLDILLHRLTNYFTASISLSSLMKLQHVNRKAARSVEYYDSSRVLHEQRRSPFNRRFRVEKTIDAVAIVSQAVIKRWHSGTFVLLHRCISETLVGLHGMCGVCDRLPSTHGTT